MHIRVAKLTIRVAQRYLADYSSVKSRHDFTQAQLLTCLVLKTVTRNDYRGIRDLLLISPPLREAIGLTKVPHWTTLQKFMCRSDVPEIVEIVLAAVLEEVDACDRSSEVAVDSTGMQSGVASLHFTTKRWKKGGKARKPVKVSVAVLCGVLLPVALVVDIGASADMKQMPQLMEQIENRFLPSRLFADAGYDAEWVHEVCRDRWGTESFIPPVARGPNKVVRTKWRSRMSELPLEYGRRWHVESFFSGLKRTMLSTLSSRKSETLIAEASIKVLAYAARRDEITA